MYNNDVPQNKIVRSRCWNKIKKEWFSRNKGKMSIFCLI